MLCLLGALPPGLSAQTSRAADEHRLKAAIIYRFTQFVEWPASATAGRNTVELCVAARSPIGASLRQLVADDTSDAPRLDIRDVAPGDAVTSCHVLVVPPQGADESQLMKQVAGRPVLTVGESPTFLDGGGVIRLHIVDRRVRFDVDVAAATRGGLTLSSQLLRLASDVRGQPR